MVRLSGKVAAVTGGARGIGYAVAEALLERGMGVAIGDLDDDAAVAAAERLGPRATAAHLDVTDAESFAAFLDGVEEDHGPIDVLVNNAGIMLVGSFVKETQDAADAMIDVNVRGVILGCRLVLPRMLERADGHIVNISSIAGKTGLPGGATYAATKHAVVGLTDSLRAEVRDGGVQVSAVMPTTVDTDLGAGIGSGIAPMLTPRDVAEVVVHVLENRRNEATVPRWIAAISNPVAALPSRARETIARLTGAERALTDELDYEARADYERSTGVD